MARGRSAAQRVAVEHSRRFGTFVGIGLICVGVNLGTLTALEEGARLPVLLAGALAGQLAILASFTLNNALTWRGLRGRPLSQRFALFELVSLGGLVLYLLTLGLVHTVLGFHYLLGGVLGSGLAALFNYAVNHTVIFIEVPETGAAIQPS